MEFVNIHQAKTHLSRYLEQISHSEDIIVICKNGVPIAQLSSYKEVAEKKIGVLKGKVKISHNFDDELPDQIMEGYK